MEVEMADIPRGAKLIVAGDFSVDLEGKYGRGLDEDITAAIATAGLEYLAGHFPPQ